MGQKAGMVTSITGPVNSAVLNLGLTAVVLFGAFRFALRCYKQIFRNGSVHAFSREVLSDLLAGVLFGVVFWLLGLPFRPRKRKRSASKSKRTF